MHPEEDLEIFTHKFGQVVAPSLVGTTREARPRCRPAGYVPECLTFYDLPQKLSGQSRHFVLELRVRLCSTGYYALKWWSHN